MKIKEQIMAILEPYGNLAILEIAAIPPVVRFVTDREVSIEDKERVERFIWAIYAVEWSVRLEFEAYPCEPKNNTTPGPD